MTTPSRNTAGMADARSLDLLAHGAAGLGVRLDERQLEQFRRYGEALLEWNKRMNLTAITAWDEVQVKHFLDSLTVALAFSGGLPQGARLLDVGAGAGFPGIPLKIAFPGLRLALLEVTQKKASFLAHVVKELDLGDVQVIAERAEAAARRPEHREAYDVVVARALAPMAALAELTLPFCKPRGCLVAMKKGDIAEEVPGAQRAITLLGGRLREVKPVSAPGLEDGRVLVIVDKVSPAPAAYPRRAGLPAKRPLS